VSGGSGIAASGGALSHPGEKEVSGVFQTEGPLSEDYARLYVQREEDSRVDACVRRGDYVALMGARQMGKTSLLLRLRRQLLDEGHVPIFVDLSPGKGEGREAWYGYFESAVREHLRRIMPGISVPPIRDQFDFRSALQQIPSDLERGRQIVFLLDEVGAVPSPLAEPFFSTIRAVFSERAFFPEFKRCVFVMAGTFVPDKLIKDPDVSPFNIAHHVYMSDADPAGVEGLVHHLEVVGSTVPPHAAERAFYWTDGHLYFTQRLCSVLQEGEPGVLSEQSVDEAAAAITSDENIARIYEKLEDDGEARQALRRRVLGRRKPFGDGPLRFNRASRLVARLELLGAVKCDDVGNCVVRNRIYEQALEQYFAEAPRVRKRSTRELSSSLGDQVVERGKSVLDEVIAGGVMALAAAILRRAYGPLQDQAERLQYVAVSAAAVVLVVVAYTAWKRWRR